MLTATWLRRYGSGVRKSQGKPDSASWPASRPACGSHRKVPSNAFQIAAPGPTRWPDRLLEYGTAAGSPQAPRGCAGATCDRPDSRLGYPEPRLIFSSRFDKGSRAADLAVRIVGAFGRLNRRCMRFDPVLGGTDLPAVCARIATAFAEIATSLPKRARREIPPQQQAQEKSPAATAGLLLRF